MADASAASTAAAGAGVPLHELRRTLSARDLILLVIGSVIGSGIFIVPGAMMRNTGGSLGLALTVWIVAGVVSLFGALTYGELGAMSPEAGGLYVFIRDAFGPLPAFLFGWTLFFVLGSGAVATLAVAAAAYFGQFVPLSPTGTRVTSVLVVAGIAAVNVRGTKSSAHFQDWTTLVKAGAIVLMSVLLLLLRGAPAGAGEVIALPASAGGIGAAVIAALWAYEGWQFVTYSAGEAEDPQRTFPRAIVLGTATLIGIYLLANLAYVAALGGARVAASDRVAADAVAVVLGPVAGKVIAAVIIVSVVSAANSVVLTAPRVFFAMARDGVFVRRLAAVHPRYGTPAVAVVATSAWAALLAATGTFEQLLTYVVFTGWIFYALAAASVFVYRRTRPDAVRPYRVPGYPVTPAVFVLGAAALVVNTVLTQPARALAGIGIMLLGVPGYLIWRARSPRS